jgi:hypothetical protein
LTAANAKIYLVTPRRRALRLQQGHSFAVSFATKEAAVLSYCRRVAFVVVFVLATPLGFAAEVPTPKQIAQWIEQLGDNRFAVRENASKQLWQAGAAAESAVEKAVKSDDPEVVRRARDLFDKFRWGIYPDTPPDIVALIRAYRSSEDNTRLEILQKLLDGGDMGLRSVFKIASAEKDAHQRKRIGDFIASKIPSALLSAVTEDKYEQFERLLERGHDNKFLDHAQYAAYWLLRGKLTERIALFEARWKPSPGDKWCAETLVYLHRANNDLPAARKAAEKCGRDDLLEGILQEMADWQALAARPFEAVKIKPGVKGVYEIDGLNEPAEKWAYRAAYTRLAGKRNDFDLAVCELRKFAGGKAEFQARDFAAAKGLLLNDRVGDGLDLLRTIPERQVLLFDILCARLDYKAALNLKGANNKEAPNLDLARARLLCFLGENKGEKEFVRYGESIKDETDTQWVENLLAEEIRSGLRELAFAHAAKAMNAAPLKTGRRFDGKSLEEVCLAQLFPQQTATAQVWWTVLRRQFKDETTATVLKRLRDLLEGKVAVKDVKAWIEETELWLTESKESQPHAAERLALAEVAMEAGLDDLAVSLLEKADSRDALLRLGDVLAAKKKWNKAAQRYRQAWRKKKTKPAEQLPLPVEPDEEGYDPLPLFLAGDALVRAGREAEGKKRIEQAHWLPLADVSARHQFVRALAERGHREAARRETDLIRRVSEPNSYYSGAAIRRQAVAALLHKDYAKAACGFEQSMLRCLHSYTTFVSPDGYVNVPAQIHQLRASELLAAGKIEEALKEAALALDDAPGHVDTPIALVPHLERLGRKKEAAVLFERCNALYEKVCRDYPRCAWAHNSTAWMSACCRRQLDTALAHAEKAVELAPTHAGYLDTLAEIHFQRGDQDKAIAAQKRAIELDPKRAYYRKQLKRMEAGDPKAEHPSEFDE